MGTALSLWSGGPPGARGGDAPGGAEPGVARAQGALPGRGTAGARLSLLPPLPPPRICIKVHIHTLAGTCIYVCVGGYTRVRIPIDAYGGTHAWACVYARRICVFRHISFIGILREFKTRSKMWVLAG